MPLPSDPSLDVERPYTTRAPIHLKDTCVIPAGSTLLIAWGADPSHPKIVRWHAGAPDAPSGRLLKLSGRTLGKALAGTAPTDEEVDAWAFDSVCETPTGDDVEADGYGPDGCPSWLLLLGRV